MYYIILYMYLPYCVYNNVCKLYIVCILYVYCMYMVIIIALQCKCNLIVVLACFQVVMESGHHSACSSRAQTDVEKQI